MELFYYRGISYERGKQWPAAEKDFQKALEFARRAIRPELSRLYLGRRRKKLDQALTMLKKAVSQRPEDGYIVD